MLLKSLTAEFTALRSRSLAWPVATAASAPAIARVDLEPDSREHGPARPGPPPAEGLGALLDATATEPGDEVETVDKADEFVGRPEEVHAAVAPATAISPAAKASSGRRMGAVGLQRQERSRRTGPTPVGRRHARAPVLEEYPTPPAAIDWNGS